MRRLPGPAVCRLSGGDHTPEAHLVREVEQPHGTQAQLREAQQKTGYVVFSALRLG
jgi:hypothetical protein